MPKTGRIAPNGGYNWGEKRQYRRNVWATARAYFHGQVADKRVLLMPSKEGDEVEVALDAGFRENNMVLVDRNAAIAAHLKRRFRRATAYGATLREALHRAAASGQRFDVINADLCGAIGAPFYREIEGLTDADALTDNAIIFVTVLKGRERSEDFADGGVPKDRIATKTPEERAALFARLRRFSVLLACTGAWIGHRPTMTRAWTAPYHAFEVRAEQYASTAGTLRMQWYAMGMHRAPCFCSRHLALWYAIVNPEFKVRLDEWGLAEMRRYIGPIPFPGSEVVMANVACPEYAAELAREIVSYTRHWIDLDGIDQTAERIHRSDALLRQTRDEWGMPSILKPLFGYEWTTDGISKFVHHVATCEEFAVHHTSPRGGLPDDQRPQAATEDRPPLGVGARAH